MLVTREYTMLYSKDGNHLKILPNVEFKPFEGNYTVGSYARIRDSETGEITTLRPGQEITGIGKVEKPKPKRKRKVKDES